jgi:hypothetical protein
VAAVSTPTSRTQLTSATDEWVGAAQEPAVPFRNMTEFDRLVAHFESMDITEAVALAGIPGAGGLISSTPPPPPPAVEARRVAKRTLGASRRLGLRGNPGEQAEPAHSTQDQGTPGAAVGGVLAGEAMRDERTAPAEVTDPEQPVGDSWTLAGGFTSGPADDDTALPPPEPPPQEDERLAALDRAVAELRDRRPGIDVGDARAMDELAGHLYRHVRSRLRAELLIDRERSGRLADTR